MNIIFTDESPYSSVYDAESATRFLVNLHRLGMLYHPEESAGDCLRHHGIGRAFLWQIENNMRACFRFLPDPCQTALNIVRQRESTSC